MTTIYEVYAGLDEPQFFPTLIQAKRDAREQAEFYSCDVHVTKIDVVKRPARELYCMLLKGRAYAETQEVVYIAKGKAKPDVG